MVVHYASGVLTPAPLEDQPKQDVRVDLPQYQPTLIVQAAAILAVAPDRRSVAVHDAQGNLLRIHLDSMRPADPPLVGSWAIRHPDHGWIYQSAADFERDWNPVHGPRLI